MHSQRTIQETQETPEPAAQNPKGEQGMVRVQVHSKIACWARWHGVIYCRKINEFKGEKCLG